LGYCAPVFTILHNLEDLRISAAESAINRH
jgi:hypothetical protein